MKKVLYIFLGLSLMFGCSDDSEDDSVQEEACNCVKTSWYRSFPTGSSNNVQYDILGTENVPCQEQETQVTTSSDSSGSNLYYYTICCDNLDNLIQCD